MHKWTFEVFNLDPKSNLSDVTDRHTIATDKKIQLPRPTMTGKPSKIGEIAFGVQIKARIRELL